MYIMFSKGKGPRNRARCERYRNPSGEVALESEGGVGGSNFCPGASLVALDKLLNISLSFQEEDN